MSRFYAFENSFASLTNAIAGAEVMAARQLRPGAVASWRSGVFVTASIKLAAADFS